MADCDLFTHRTSRSLPLEGNILLCVAKVEKLGDYALFPDRWTGSEMDTELERLHRWPPDRSSLLRVRSWFSPQSYPVYITRARPFGFSPTPLLVSRSGEIGRERWYINSGSQLLSLQGRKKAWPSSAGAGKDCKQEIVDGYEDETYQFM